MGATYTTVMISGRVRENGDAAIRLIVRGFHGQEIEIEAVIDTGYSGELSLRPSDVLALGLLQSSSVDTVLADGTIRDATPVYTAVVEWDGIEHLVQTTGDDPEPLVGMQLLRGFNLSIDVMDGGTVRISRLP